MRWPDGIAEAVPAGPPDPEGTDVWFASAALAPTQLRELVAGLEPEDRERVGRYLRPEDQARAAVGRWLLGTVAAAALGVGPLRLQLLRRCAVCGEEGHGKPRLLLGGAPAPLEVNLSHAGELVAVAVARPGRPVGVDVERSRDSVDWPSLRRMVFSTEEWSATDGAVDPVRARWQAWSAKEAVVKASGHGLAVRLSGVRVGLVGPATERVPWSRASHPVSEPEGTLVRGWVRALPVPAGYVGALAVTAERPGDVRVRAAARGAAPAGPGSG